MFSSLPFVQALTLIGDNIPAVTDALVVDGNVKIGAERNGKRRNLIVTGTTTLVRSSCLPKLPAWMVSCPPTNALEQAQQHPFLLTCLLQGSGAPGTPVALTTKGGVDIKGHLRALTANIVGQLTGE